MFTGSPKQIRTNMVLEGIIGTEKIEDTEEILKRLDEKGFRADDLIMMLEDELATLRLLQTIRDVRKQAGILDRLFEFYSNAIFSGPMTHMKNLTSNTAFMGWVLTERQVEAVLNKLTRNVHGTQLGELPYVMSGMWNGMGHAARNFARTFAYEESALAMELGISDETTEKYDVGKPSSKFAIRGPFGRVVRTSWRALSASDDFFKTLIASGQVGGHAYRMGKRNRLQGKTLGNYIESQVGDFGSTSWYLAYEDAREMTFQQKGGPMAQWMKGIGRFLRKGPGKFFFPVMGFPINALEAALARMPIVGLVEPMMQMQWGKSPVNKQRVASRQLMGSLASMVIYSMVFGGDDDEGNPLITGSAEESYLDRALEYRTAPPQSIRIGGTYRSYAGIDPFATVTATIVDAMKKPKTWQEMPGKMRTSLLNQVSDKTYLQTLGDLLNVMFGDDKRDVTEIPTGIAAGFIPNIYRQPMRAYRNKTYEMTIKTSDTWAETAAKTLRKAEIPILGIEYKYDTWGRPISASSPGTYFAARLLNPFPAKLETKDILPADMAIVRWNELHPVEPYKDVKHGGGWRPGFPDRGMGIGQPKMSDDEYEGYVQRAGSLALTSANKRDYSNPPTAGDIVYIQRVLSWARSAAKAEVKAKRYQSRQGNQ